MDLARLRQILGPFIEALKDLETHERLGSLCERLGLPNPDGVGSKRDRLIQLMAPNTRWPTRWVHHE